MEREIAALNGGTLPVSTPRAVAPGAALKVVTSRACPAICDKLARCKVGRAFASNPECVSVCDGNWNDATSQKEWTCLGAAASCDALARCEKD